MKLSPRALEFRARFPELAQGQSHAEIKPREDEDAFHGPWLSSLDGARYLRRPSRDAFRKWARRHGVVAVSSGGRMLYAKADVDRVLNVRRSRRSA